MMQHYDLLSKFSLFDLVSGQVQEAFYFFQWQPGGKCLTDKSGNVIQWLDQFTSNHKNQQM